MKSIKILGIGLSFVIALIACEAPTETSSNSTAEKEQKHEVEKHKKHDADKNQIALNNGERWKVNPEMKPHLEAAEKRLIAYRDNTETDYRTLAVELKSINELLISSCTMKGESHDQLHLWLHPHLQLVKALSEAKSQQEADSIITKLEASFETYHKYFN